ncbi:MAG: hypothetical protein U1F11_04280 [Steroidobacteraceae bacterium]
MVAVQHEERRRLRVDLHERRSEVPEVVVGARGHHRAREPVAHRAAVAPQSEPIREVVDPIVGHAALHGGIRGLEAGLQRRASCRERDQRREMRAGGAAGDRHEARVGAEPAACARTQAMTRLASMRASGKRAAGLSR